MKDKRFLEERVEDLEKEVRLLKEMLGGKKIDQPVTTRAPEGETLSINEAMKLLGLDRHILYAKCNAGDIPYFRVCKLYRFKKNELLEWLDAQQSTKGVNTDDAVTKYLAKNPIRG